MKKLLRGKDNARGKLSTSKQTWMVIMVMIMLVVSPQKLKGEPFGIIWKRYEGTQSDTPIIDIIVASFDKLWSVTCCI